MQYHEDLYGIQVDEEAFRENESATTGALAERLMDVIDVDLGGFYSESRGGVCYKSSYDEEIDVLIAPNHVVERDDEYWREDKHRQFALLLIVGSKNQERLKSTRSALGGAKNLGLTLIRSS